ncbi:MAG TPA: tyrosine-type recombinase/integrase [Streptosporangiaceae bacterium]|nr:tyrosine-type recombinase/integrase [Streptosporangiaceae bacterium]
MTSMQETVGDYLALRRALGYKLKQDGQLLRDFAARLDAGDVRYLTVEAAAAWATAPPGVTPYWHSYRLRPVRLFSRYLHALDHRHEVIPGDLLPGQYTRAAPYIFTAGEVIALMHAARRLSRRLPAATYQALIGMLAVTGMRPGEAYALDRDDVDLDAAAITITSSKNHTCRQLPLHATTVDALAGYARHRDQLCPHPAGPSFLVSVRGTRLHPRVAGEVFAGLARSAGLRARSPRTRPVLRSFRHTFAVSTLIGWYQDGADVDARMPVLSGWLGHAGPRSTYWYYSDSRVIPIPVPLHA